MNSKNIFSFCVLVITVLAVNLLTQYISQFVLVYRHITNPFKYTAIGMAIIVAILYPSFKFLNEIVKAFTRLILKKGKYLFGKTIGMIILFMALIFILYCIYAYLWFRINVIKILLDRAYSLVCK